MSFSLIALACLVSAVLYRAGGMGKEVDAKPTWMPMKMRKSWVRDWLCPGVMLILVILLFGIHLKYWWCYIIFYPLSGAAFSTYWDKVFGTDNFYAHGLGLSLAMIPLLWCGLPWWILLVHGIVCTVGMGLWSNNIGTDWLEEMGRGVLYIL